MVRLTHSHSLSLSPTHSLTHSPSLSTLFGHHLTHYLVHPLTVCVGVLYSEFLSTADFEKVRKYAEVSVLVSRVNILVTQ